MSEATEQLDGDPLNAALSWSLIALLLVSAAESLAEDALLWAGFSVVVVGTALGPAVVARSPSVLVSWEILALSAIPAATRLVDVFAEPTAYLSLAALALLVVAQIDAFTTAELTPRFAAVMVALATLSVAGFWGIAQFAADAHLGTSYLAGETELMVDLVVASAVGIGAGVAFEVYCTDREGLDELAGEA